MDLGDIRKRIDRLDTELLKLLNRRMELALQTVKLKKGVHDSGREKEVLEHVAEKSADLLEPVFAEALYKLIMEESKKIQNKGLKLIAFQGEHGAYGEMAAVTYDSSAIKIPCDDFREVFEGVQSGLFDFGLVPVENSTAGPVLDVNDLLLETELHIYAEVSIPVHHCILVLPDTDYREIKMVYSHPMALAQCKGFISRNKIEPRTYYDTAGAARMLSEKRPKATSVIASKLCAEMYDLEVIKENVEDHPKNSTRFFVISKERAESGDRCTIAFSTQHRAGGLFDVLRLFYEAGINLTRIESRPLADDPGRFAFLLDFMGSENEEKVKTTLEKVKNGCSMYRMVGCYREVEA